MVLLFGIYLILIRFLALWFGQPTNQRYFALLNYHKFQNNYYITTVLHHLIISDSKLLNENAVNYLPGAPELIRSAYLTHRIRRILLCKTLLFCIARRNLMISSTVWRTCCPCRQCFLRMMNNSTNTYQTSITPFVGDERASEIVSLARAKLRRGTSNNLCTAPY